MDNQTRLPRPKGFTNLLYHAQSAQTEKQIKRQKLKQIKMLILEQWVLSSYTMNNKECSIDEMAAYLNWDRDKVQSRANEIMIAISQQYEDKALGAAGIARVMISQASKKILKSVAIAESQAELLLANQGQEYVPFLSSAVNQAIANQSASLKPMLELIRLLQPTGATILNKINMPTQNNTTNYISADQAITMIREKTPSPIEIENGTDGLIEPGLPDISPRTQDISQITTQLLTNKPAEDIKRKSQLAHGKRDRILEIDEDPKEFQA